MTEPTEIKPNQQKEKTPVDGALNSIHEAAAKALQSKLKEQIEKTVKAFQVAHTEKKVLAELIEQSKEDKNELKKILADIL